MTHSKTLLALAICSALPTSFTYADEAPVSAEEQNMEKIAVVGRSVSYSNNATSDHMIAQQSNLTSVLAMIDNLPGVLINEGDTFGSDDWSTTVSIRGFQLSLDEQQIGITVDGIANGNSNYGGGAKANRYIDTENLALVEVSQGTSDIASRSNEALGGTLNFTTIEPEADESLLLSVTQADFDAQKYFVRYNTGELAKDTYAWVSVSTSSNSDWIQQSAENERDHVAAKFISDLDHNWRLTGYGSYDDVHEDNYQRVSKAQFIQNPEWDRLTDEWTGIPYVDQSYRRGWSTLRENIFTYLQADYQGDNLQFGANVYYHHNKGRGDWVPQYVVDVKEDGADGHSELESGQTYYGGSAIGTILFVDGQGNSLSPMEDCQSSITFPYGGAGAAYDPNCYASGAIPVGSYRHTHYKKERVGFNADFAWTTQLNDTASNALRGGIWYEDYQRDEYRDWHKIIDSATSYEFDYTPYWVQYSRTFNVDTTMLYLEDEMDAEWIKARVGVKKFMVDLDAEDNFGVNPPSQVSSDSDALLSAGLVVLPGIEGVELFAGYAENFAAIKDTVLERDASTLTQISPETADNIDVGLRFTSSKLDASITLYNIKFENRITFIAPDDVDGINYLIGTNGSYINIGGIESEGFEASVNYRISNEWSTYFSYTSNDSTYSGKADDQAILEEQGITVGNTVYGSAEDMMVFSIDWQRDQYMAGLSSKWVGDRWLDAANTTRVDDYTVADFYAGVSLDAPIKGISSLDIRFTINNITDKNYLGGISGQAAWIGAPRTAAINLQASF